MSLDAFATRLCDTPDVLPSPSDQFESVVKGLTETRGTVDSRESKRLARAGENPSEVRLVPCDARRSGNSAAVNPYRKFSTRLGLSTATWSRAMPWLTWSSIKILDGTPS